MRIAYQSDLSDTEWRCLKPHLPASKTCGRPRLHSPREILDAILYILKSGLRLAFAAEGLRTPWKTAYDWFRRWRIDETWERMNAELRALLRVRLGRDPEPSAAIVDSQLVKSTGVGGNERGFDPAKKVEGRKRHLLVDTEGLVLQARVHSARVPDQDGIRLLLERIRGRFGRLSHLWVDAGYQGRGKKWTEEVFVWSVEVVRKPRKPVPEKVAQRWATEWAKEGKELEWQKFMPPKGFQVLPRRWVVERTFAWISHNRRMAKDYERLCATGEALVYAAMMRLMVRRLARA